MENKKKHIVLVANTTWNIFNFRLNLIQKFLSEGFEVSVVAPIDEYIEYKERYPKVKHYNLHYLKRTGINPIFDILFCLELIRRYRLLKPDIVIHFTNKPNIYGGIASGLTFSKSIAVVTGLGYAFIHSGFVNYFTKLLYRFSANFHRKIIFENQEDKLLFENLRIVNSSSSIAVKGCGVDTSFYKPIETVISNKTIFTFVGRLLNDKGIREFVAAAKEIKANFQQVEFWIIGELDTENPATIEKENLVRWIDEGIIQYHGFQRDVRPLMAASDCIVLPSYREGNPRTITEAMSMGKAVITTNIGGCRENVEDGVNGYLVKIKDNESLSQALRKFLNLTPLEKKKMGELGRLKAIKEFDSQLIAQEYLGVVNNVLNNE